MKCNYWGTDSECTARWDSCSRWDKRVNHNFHSFWLCHLAVIFLINCKDSFISTEEIVDPMRTFFEFLKWISRYFLSWVLILVNVTDLNFILLTYNISHHEVLFKGCWKYWISTVVDVLTNDIHSAWGSAKESWSFSVYLLESVFQVLVSWFMLWFHCSICVMINFWQMIEGGNKLKVCILLLAFH